MSPHGRMKTYRVVTFYSDGVLCAYLCYRYYQAVPGMERPEEHEVQAASAYDAKRRAIKLRREHERAREGAR